MSSDWCILAHVKYHDDMCSQTKQKQQQKPIYKVKDNKPSISPNKNK